MTGEMRALAHDMFTLRFNCIALADSLTYASQASIYDS